MSRILDLTPAIRSSRFWTCAGALALTSASLAGPVDHIKKVLATDGATQDRFGHGVAISDGYCFIGAPEHDVNGVFSSGAAYIYGADSGGIDNWGFVNKRNELAPANGDRMGAAIELDDDLALVGLWGDDDNGASSGGAYLYGRDQGGVGAWGVLTKLLASDGATQDNFGISVDLSGNIAIVGAIGPNSHTGAAYIFEKNFGGAGNWGQSKKLEPLDGGADWHFGHAVAVQGSIAAVGAHRADGIGNNSGAVYVYEANPASAPEGPGGTRSNTWKLVKKLVAPDEEGGALFGSDVAVHNGTVLVGSFYKQTVTNERGSAYIFHRNQGGAGNYGFVKQINNPGADAYSQNFGRSVDLDGDIAVFGSAQVEPGHEPTGAVYVYERNIGGADNWGLLQRIKAPDTADGDFFGTDVAIDGTDIVSGAVGDTDAGPYTGSAHIFRINSICPADLNGDGVVDTADLGILLGSFGMSGLGDLNLDGVIDTADLGILLGGFSATDCMP